MTDYAETPEYLPISRINAFSYCARRFYYEVVLAEMIVNEHVLEGSQLHERVDTPGQTTRGDALQLRRLYLCAPHLGVSGYCDLVETQAGEPRDPAGLAALAQAGQLYPVEYKKGKMGEWIS